MNADYVFSSQTIQDAAIFLGLALYASSAILATIRLSTSKHLNPIGISEEFHTFHTLNPIRNLILWSILHHAPPRSLSRACLGMEIRPRPASPNALLKH